MADENSNLVGERVRNTDWPMIGYDHFTYPTLSIPTPSYLMRQRTSIRFTSVDISLFRVYVFSECIYMHTYMCTDMFVSLKKITVRYNSTKMLYIQHFGDLILPIVILFDSEYKISLPLIETEK